MYSLLLSANEYTDLPSSIDIGDKIQLTVMFHIYGGSVLPEYVTSKGVTYKSSNEKIVKIDDKGLVYGYLKQVIDLNFLINLSQDTIMLKICKFCHKAFVPKNSKVEYDTPQCKNKANVYSFRKRTQQEDN